MAGRGPSMRLRKTKAGLKVEVTDPKAVSGTALYVQVHVGDWLVAAQTIFFSGSRAMALFEVPTLASRLKPGSHTLTVTPVSGVKGLDPKEASFKIPDLNRVST